MPFVEGKVISVADGDTFTLELNNNKRFHVRLQGVNAPEKQQPHGPESRQNLMNKLLGKSVKVDFTKTDNLGRVLGKVIFEGEDVGFEQLNSGYGWFYTHFANELNDDDRLSYAEAQDAAKNAMLGLWKDKSPVAPWTYRKTHKIDEAVEESSQPTVSIVGNSRTKIYFRPGCPGYKTVPVKSSVPFASEVEAERAGYRLAKNCR